MSSLKPRVSSSSNFASLSNVMRDNSSALFHLKLYMLSTKGTHQVQIFRFSAACMKINQIPFYFSSHESVFTCVLHHLVSYIVSQKFSSWNITLWTKKAHQSTNFNESLPNSSCQFWNHKVNHKFIQILHHHSVWWKISPLCVFLSQTFILLIKRAHWSEIFKLSSDWVKIYQIPYVIFETTSQFLLNFTSFFSVMRDNSSVLF